MILSKKVHQLRLLLRFCQKSTAIKPIILILLKKVQQINRL